MADSNKIIGEYKVDLSKLRAELEKNQKETKKLHDIQESLTKALKDGKISTSEYQKQITQLTNREKQLTAQSKVLAEQVKKNLNQSFVKTADVLDNANKSMGAFSSIASGNLLGAMGALKSAFLSLGGPMGVVVGFFGAIVTWLVPFEKIGDIFSDMGKNIKNFFGIADELENAADSAEKLADNLTYAQKQMEELKKNSEDINNTLTARSSLYSEFQKREENAFLSTGNVENLRQASKEYKKILDEQQRSINAQLQSLTAQMDLEVGATETWKKLDAERDKVYENILSDTEIEVKLREYENELQSRYNQLLKDRNKLSENQRKQNEINKSELENAQKAVKALEKAEDLRGLSGLTKQLVELDYAYQDSLASAEKALSKVTDPKAIAEIRKQIDLIKKAYNLDIEDLLKKQNEVNKKQIEEQEKLYADTQASLDKWNAEYQASITSGLTQIQIQNNNALAELDRQEKAEIEKVKENAELVEQIKAKYNLLRLKQEKDTQDRIAEYSRKKTEEEIANSQKILKAYSTAFQGLGKVFNNLASLMKEGSDEFYSMSVMSIILSQASSIANGIKTVWESSSNWIEGLIASASVVAEIVGLFAQVRSLRSQADSYKQNYATGGLVSGKTQRNSTADDIPVNVSAGEFIVNSNATADNLALLNALNAPNSNNFMLSMYRAISNIQPVVSVDSIEKQKSKYNHVKSFSKL